MEYDFHELYSGVTSKVFTTIFVSKMAQFVLLKGTPSAAETATTFIKEVACLHGILIMAYRLLPSSRKPCVKL